MNPELSIDTLTVRRPGRGRWLRALAVAALVAAWPACELRDHWANSGGASSGAPGTPSLDVVLKDMHGADVRLADFRGRPLLINFWATWCAPCKAETPWFNEYAVEYREKNLAVLGVSIDDTPEDIKKFAADYKVDYPLLVGNGHDAVLESFEASAVIPVSWLIKADGAVFLKVQGIHPREWFDKQIKTLVEGS